MEKLSIRALHAGESAPFDLLYLADPHREAVADYLVRGRCFVALSGSQIVGEYVLLPTRPFTAELVNLAVDERFQGRCIGRSLVEHCIRQARNEGFHTLEVGTGNAGIGQLALYQRCGFTIVGIDFDFFTRHYPEPIIENGIPCRHMIRLRLELDN